MEEREVLMLELRNALTPSDQDEARIRAGIHAALAASALAATGAVLSAGSTSAVGSAGASSGAGALGSALSGSALSGSALSGSALSGSALKWGSGLSAWIKWSAVLSVSGLVGAGGYLASTSPASPSAPVSVASSAERPSESGQMEARLNAEDSEQDQELSKTSTEDPSSHSEKNEKLSTQKNRAFSAPPRDGEQNADTLSVELDLLSRANRALRAGDAAGAMAAVTEHAKRFPQGKLSLERQGVQALALCLSGSLEAGQKVGRRVMNQAPGSPLVGRIQKTCGMDP